MDTTSTIRSSDHERCASSPQENTGHQNYKLKSGHMDDGSITPMPVVTGNADSDRVINPVQDDRSIRTKCRNEDAKHNEGKNPSRSSSKRKRVYSKLTGRRYPLRSAMDGVRVLRSMSKGKSATPTSSVRTPVKSVCNPVNPETGRKRKKRRVKKPSDDEFSINRKRLRYWLTRMGYEQNLIDAYSGEGWKGQSLEKIRPEKEIERAKSEIIRCKLKIRDLFQHIDASFSQGQLHETLFDHEGKISCDDIFCARCGLKDLNVDNDIILCDGICNRGFHQKCLNPPLQNEDIPPGDDGWLCPACDCKADCIDLLNEAQVSDLSIEDTWEEVFPEAAAVANGTQNVLGLPSDDSEDDNYDPNVPEIDVENCREGSSSEESDFTSSPENSDSNASENRKHSDTLGLPSDDSEDDDYDPDGIDPDGKVQKASSNSDESDFSSDSDEFMGELHRSSGIDEGRSSPLSGQKPLDLSSEGTCMEGRKKSSIKSDPLSLVEPDINGESAIQVSGKRTSERLDYKKLYDETYGEESSDSSDDDDWRNSTTPKKDEIGQDSVLLPKVNSETTGNQRSVSRSMRKFVVANTARKGGLDQKQVSEITTEVTPEKASQKLDPTVANHSITAEYGDPFEPGSDCNGKKASSSVRRSLGKVISQRLLESFKQNQYPTRETKETLAAEIGKTPRQVSKWFEKARHQARIAANEATTPQKTVPTVSGQNSSSDNGVVRSASHNGAKEEKSDRDKKCKAEAEHDTTNGDEMKAVDDKRQNLIARELRKIRKNKHLSVFQR